MPKYEFSFSYKKTNYHVGAADLDVKESLLFLTPERGNYRELYIAFSEKFQNITTLYAGRPTLMFFESVEQAKQFDSALAKGDIEECKKLALTVDPKNGEFLKFFSHPNKKYNVEKIYEPYTHKL